MCTGRNKMHVSVPSLNFHVDKYFASYAPHASKYIKAKCPLLSITVRYCPIFHPAVLVLLQANTQMW
jgi:hypothetical protein